VTAAGIRVTGVLLSKVRTADGALLGTYSSQGAHPVGVAFDGANIWVANQLSNNVVKK
jgi:hypothetical protein